MANVIYTGLFLKEKSRLQLLTFFKPKHPNLYADHATLVFRPSPEQVRQIEEYNLGDDEIVELRPTGYAEDEKGQVLLVEPLSPLKVDVTTSCLHITISCANGVSPVYSNDLARNAQPFPSWISMTFMADLGRCSREDKAILPVEMHKRRGL